MCTVQEFTLSAAVLTALGVCQEDVLTDEQATNFYFDLHALLAEYPPQSGSQNNDPQLNQLAHYHIGGY